MFIMNEKWRMMVGCSSTRTSLRVGVNFSPSRLTTTCIALSLGIVMEEFIEMDLYGDDDPDGLRTVDRDLWEKMQERTFAAWCNDRLKPRRKFINNRLAVDLNDGTLLINLLQVVSGKDFGSYSEKPKDKFEKLANCKLSFDFMKSEGINLVGIGKKNKAGCVSKRSRKDHVIFFSV